MRDRIGVLLWVIKLQLKGSRGFIAWKLFYSTYDGVTPIIIAYATAKLLAAVAQVAIATGDAGTVYFWLSVVSGIGILSSIFTELNSLIGRKYDMRIELMMNEVLYGRLYQLSQAQFDDEAFNTKLERAKEGLFASHRILDDISWGFSSFLRFTTTIGALIAIQPLVAIFIICSLIPMAIATSKQNRLTDEAYRKTDTFQRIAYRTRWLLITPHYMAEVRLANAFKDLVQHWTRNMKRSNEILYTTERRATMFRSLAAPVQTIVEFGANVYFFRLLLAGTIGLDRFIFLRGILIEAANATSGLVFAWDRLHEMNINLQNYREIHQTIPLLPQGTIKPKPPLKIEFRNVTFRYPGASDDALQAVNFVIEPGERLALVGENGAGKSTIVKLLLRLYAPSSGEILINDTSILDIDPIKYYTLTSNLSQDFLSFTHLTIRDNLSAGNDRKLDDEDLLDALRLVHADAFVQKLPNGLSQRMENTFKDGSTLSGGQYQRIAIARTLLREGALLILDEPTSAIDAKAEYEIFSNIFKQSAERTTLIVSHRFSTVRKADIILVIDNGKITQRGSHDELIQEQGTYKEMFETQAEGYR